MLNIIKLKLNITSNVFYKNFNFFVRKKFKIHKILLKKYQILVIFNHLLLC